MKYLVIGEYDPDETKAMLEKAKAWMEDKEKHHDRYPESLFSAHHMLNTNNFSLSGKPRTRKKWLTRFLSCYLR
jgi:hypothetical protein